MSTRKVDNLVRALGLDGVSRSEVLRICAELDEAMERVRSRPLEGEDPSVWLDATPVRVRYSGRVVFMAAVVAIGVRQDGQREVLGWNVGASESYEFWVEFLRLKRSPHIHALSPGVVSGRSTPPPLWNG